MLASIFIRSIKLALHFQPQVIVLAGESVSYRHDTDRELLFRQESNFFYLTGCNIPSSLFIASYRTSSSSDATSEPSISTTLFIPEANQADLMWSVPPPTPLEARKTHDFENVEYCPSDFGAVIEKLVKELNGAIVHTLPTDPSLWPKIPSGYTGSGAKGLTLVDTYLLPALQQARLQKDVEEIELIRRANAVSSRAHEVVMRVLGMAVKEKIGGQGTQDRPLLPGEWLIEKEAEAEALFVASCRREGYISAALIIFSLDTDCILEALIIKHTFPLSHLLHVLPPCTTVATTRSSHGVL